MTHDEMKCYPGGMKPEDAVAMLQELRLALESVYQTTPISKKDSEKHLHTQRTILDAIATICTFQVRVEAKEQP